MTSCCRLTHLVLGDTVKLTSLDLQDVQLRLPSLQRMEFHHAHFAYVRLIPPLHVATHCSGGSNPHVCSCADCLKPGATSDLEWSPVQPTAADSELTMHCVADLLLLSHADTQSDTSCLQAHEGRVVSNTVQDAVLDTCQAHNIRLQFPQMQTLSLRHSAVANFTLHNCTSLRSLDLQCASSIAVHLSVHGVLYDFSAPYLVACLFASLTP